MDQNSKGLPDPALALTSPACMGVAMTMGRKNQFLTPPHVTAMDMLLTDTIRGLTATGKSTAPTAIIEAPPRHGKTELCSKWLPVWYLLRWPDRRVIMATATHKLAKKLGRDARNLFAEHGPKFGLSVRESVRAGDEWETSEGGSLLAAGVGGGAIMGRGANLLLIDDPIRNSKDALSETVRDGHWDWWQSTSGSRLEPDGKVVVIATRWHEDDLSGRLIRGAENDEEGQSDVARLTLPAIAEPEDENSPPDAIGRKPGEALWPARFPIERLLKAKRKRTKYWWDSLFRQKPGKWGDSRWGIYLGEKIWATRWPEAFEASVVSVDPSLGKDDRKGDFSAIVFAGISGGKVWIDASIERRSSTQIATDAVAMILRHRADGLTFESNGFQEILAPSFERAAYDAKAVIPITLVVNSIKKELRIERLEPLLATGQLVFRDSPGCRLLVDQLGEFPRGDHDDGPDALEMAIRGLNHAASAAHSDPFACEFAST